jgi:thiol:disulfide interchange protein DsbD
VQVRNDVVLISLYVDDKEMLPKELQGVYETKRGTKKNIKTVGDKWSTLQSEYFGSNTQPQYILIPENFPIFFKWCEIIVH